MSGILDVPMGTVRLVIVLLGLLSGTAARPETAAAQEAGAAATATPMTPSEAHERLGFFVGTWTMAEFPAEAGFRETCEWLEAGRRHVVCQARWQARSGPRTGMSIFSYRESDSTYVYQGFRPSGAVQTLLGRVSEDGRVWEFEGEEGTGATRLRTHVEISPQADGTFRFVKRTATGDGEWSAGETVTYLAVEPRSP